MSRYRQLTNRLLFLLGALIVFRFGAHIPVPGIDPNVLAKLFQQNQSGILGMINVFSGGALARFTIFALGIMPYISASIIMQLSAELVPFLIQLKKEGTAGRKKITQYTRYFTVLLSFIQSLGIASMLYRQPGLVVVPQLEFFMLSTVCLVTGTMFLMWLGEQITERGIGNGSSMIIMTGIISGLPSGISKTLSLTAQGSMSMFTLVLIVLLVILVTFIVVFVERAQRKIPISYPRRQMRGNVPMQNGANYLPLKINLSGVIPPIFASSIILFPASLLNWLGDTSSKLFFLKRIGMMLHPGQALYIIVYVSAIIFFCFFYTALVFNPKEVAENLKKNGAFIPGIRPGAGTVRYIEKLVLRLTLIGAVYITLVCLLPQFLIFKWNVPFYFGGTSLLIIVVVIMDFMVQIQSAIMSVQYDSLLKKASLRGFHS